MQSESQAILKRNQNLLEVLMDIGARQPSYEGAVVNVKTERFAGGAGRYETAGGSNKETSPRSIPWECFFLAGDYDRLDSIMVLGLKHNLT